MYFRAAGASSQMKRPVNYFLSFALLFFCSFLSAQNKLHTIEGTVTDKSSGAVVPYTVVYLPDLNKGTVANENGVFHLSGLPGNSQKFIFTRAGYRPYATTLVFTDSLTSVSITMESSSREMEEVIILGTQSHTSDQSATTVTALSQRTLRSRGSLSISDGVARLPGVAQLSTGAGISKPVIRGLYGNRIQTVVMGMRFDNQQWQDEHGLGIQDIGVDRVEVIKGPAALMYGSEAMGGVINIIEEQPASVDSIRADASMRLFSNTYGAGLDAGVRSAKTNYFWRVRIGAESHADYSDGNNKRILNSRFDGYVGKASFGFSRRNWSCVNNYVFSKSDFGFIMDTASALIEDNRISRNFSQPHHTVFINLFTSQNTFFGKDGNIMRLVIGGHINRRMEDEGGGGISLDMQLITAALHFQFEHPLSETWTIITGLQSQYQDNKNLGWRTIVPDAILAEGSLYAYARRVAERMIFEGGLRADTRYLRTYETGTINSGSFAIPLVNKTYPALNGSAGISIELLKDLRFKANLTSGYRTPNLAELSSNGVHEGTLRYEIGDANMKIEQNFSAEAGLAFETEHFDLSVTAYNNRFLNYIYLQPTSGDYFGFRIYRYLQTNATIQGGEAAIDWTPFKSEWLDLSVNYMMIRAKTDAGNNLPFIPADRLDGSVKFELGDHGKWHDLYFRTGAQYYFPQNRPAQFETATSDYLLLDAGLGTTVQLSHNNLLNLDLCCNNLLNKVYYDHLSRFKEFEIYNMGRNICLNIKYEW